MMKWYPFTIAIDHVRKGVFHNLNLKITKINDTEKVISDYKEN